MKPTTLTLTATLVLSLALWIGYYVSSSGVTPTEGETTVVVGVSFAVVLATRALWKRVRRANPAPQDESGGDGPQG